MIKVCSHKRSGTHLLMASLAQNFNFYQELGMEAHAENGQNWYKGGKKVIVPWGQLFGTHSIDESGITDSILYIVRNPLNVLLSCYEFDGCRGTINEYASDYRIEQWRDHVDHYCSKYPHVKYESLVTQPIKTMADIKKAFKLDQQGTQLHPVTEKVGWLPKKRIGPRDGWRLSSISRVRAIIGNEFWGYKI